MATINYLYRSTRKEAPLNLRLLYSHKGKDYVLGGRTKLIISKDYWQNDHFKGRINDIDRANYQKEIKEDLTNLETHLLDAFYKIDDPTTVDKNWLKNQIDKFYNPQKEIEAPTELIKFFDFYSDLKKNELSFTRLQRLEVIQNKLKRYEDHTGETLYIADINYRFKKDFTEYSDNEQYARNTLKSDFSVIKTVCRYAGQWNIQVSPQLENLKATADNIKAPYLSFKEIEAVRNLDLPIDGHLDNARDWLVISCYTGQRISDFMRFTSDMIVQDGDDFYLEFKQQKTGKLTTIPFLKEARKVLDKRNGNFPRPISHQRYNDYIKTVCKKAGLTQKIKGMQLVCIADDPKNASRNDYRKQIGLCKKYTLVSSHIGRRSFATNYYGKVPTPVLISITGHSTEKMFLKYIHKSETDTAKDAIRYFK